MLLKRLREKSSVLSLGYSYHSEAMQYLSLCDVFSLPDWEESFGLVYLGAIAHGKPIIGCKGQGISDVIKDYENGILIVPKDL